VPLSRLAAPPATREAAKDGNSGAYHAANDDDRRATRGLLACERGGGAAAGGEFGGGGGVATPGAWDLGERTEAAEAALEADAARVAAEPLVGVVGLELASSVQVGLGLVACSHKTFEPGRLFASR
jgi:hypothetical protein